MSRVIAVVQARLGSTRLPAKVLKMVGDETVLDRLLRHLRMVPEFDQVVLAVPYDDEALAIRAYANHCGFTLGDEQDVLSRYAKAAQEWQADVVVRVTADCPLIDPHLVSESVKRYLSFKHRPGYYWMQGSPRGCGDAEIFSRTALDDAAVEETDAKHREHVYFAVMRACLRRNEAILTPWVPDAIRRPTYRCCLDEPADLDVIRAIVAELGEQANNVEAVVALLDARPDIRLLNSQVQQVSA